MEWFIILCILMVLCSFLSSFSDTNQFILISINGALIAVYFQLYRIYERLGKNKKEDEEV